MIDLRKPLNACKFLSEFCNSDYETVFQSIPDGRVPPEQFDYHVHPFWELKFSRTPALFLIHAPNTVHCTTGFDIVLSVTYRKLRLFDWTIEFDEDQQTNWLPELLDVLHHIPETENFRMMKEHLSRTIIENCLVLLRRFPGNAIATASTSPLADRVLDYMEHHYFHSDLSVGDIAGFAGVTPQMLNVALHRKTGRSIRQNLIRIRLEHAAELLKNPAYMIKDVAALTGWKSSFHFSTSFRRQYGYSPRSGR